MTSSWTCRTSRLAEALLFEPGVEAHERHLEDVRRQSLDAGVHRLALARLTDAEVARRQLGDEAAAAEQRLGVAPGRASATVRDMYAFTDGNALKYAARISAASSTGMLRRCARPYDSMP